MVTYLSLARPVMSGTFLGGECVRIEGHAFGGVRFKAPIDPGTAHSFGLVRVVEDYDAAARELLDTGRVGLVDAEEVAFDLRCGRPEPYGPIRDALRRAAMRADPVRMFEALERIRQAGEVAP